MEKSYQRMPLSRLDDIFTTEQERQEKDLERIKDINIDDIDSFPNHPFNIVENEDLYNLRDSIVEKGVISPILVRPKNNGRYEVISGHRRMYASKLADKYTIPCIVRNLSNDEAIIAMVDSNLQREHILPSEKAFAYQMKLEAEKHQGKKTYLSSCQLGTKYRTDSKIANQVGDSARQIQRYIRLTKLIKPLLDMVDEEKIAFSPAVEISFLTKEEQDWLLDSIEENLATPSLSQSQQLKRLSQDGNLTQQKVDEILSQEKANQVEKLKLEMRSLKSKMPKNMPPTKYKEYIFKALDYYNKYLQRCKDRER